VVKAEMPNTQQYLDQILHFLNVLFILKKVLTKLNLKLLLIAYKQPSLSHKSGKGLYQRDPKEVNRENCLKIINQINKITYKLILRHFKTTF